MVLGKVLAQGGGSFEIIREGRYRIAALQSSGLSGTCADDLQALLNPVPEIVFEGKIDGKAITSQPVELSIGTHHIECGSDIQPTAVWVGPRQDRLPQLGKGDHRRVFFNWY
jgi:hypothetical protein